MKRLGLFTVTFVISSLLSACGGGGGTSATITTSTKWIGTKQLGVASKNTATEGIAIDTNGNVYVAGSTNGGLDTNTLMGTQDSFLTMYNSVGSRIRTKQLGVAGKVTAANSVAIDSSGNVYVSGSTSGGLDGNTLTGSQDFFLTMYDAAGNKVRTKQLGVAGQLTVATGIAVDLSGNVYVAGYTNGGMDGNTLTGSQDFFLTMYDKNGTKIRTNQLGASGAITAANSVAVDADGNVYVAGFTNGDLDGNTLAGVKDYFLTKYDSAGNKVRTQQLGAVGYSTEATGVAVDKDKNVYIAGYTLGGLDGNTLSGTGSHDLFLTKYDIGGNRVSTKQLGVTGKITEATSVVVDANSNVHIAGSTFGGLAGNTLTGVQDYFVTTYDSTGAWVRTKQRGVSTKYTSANSVTVDANGNVYASGFTGGGLDGNTLTGIQDFFITKYDSTGIKQ